MIRAALFCLMVAGSAGAQEVAEAPGAEVRGLDKLTGSVTDMSLSAGQTAELGYLLVTLRECRYPVGDPASDAFAYITVIDSREGTETFAGWVMASSPALSAMEHPRYDVWVLYCNRP
ncbi:uncharacterized protein DUF2155 [Rhodovulum imhoffii]|uniref:Uncharacterized protein DUF2155 n=1 Tax=Rhodovulum imhoffii TaxID=365340 RepID=A0A2T5BNL7_9RHOB|nr:DUF2155 domain-containing protein [Rhodovulum imhoffii]MBK5933779.1 hypothetical protein [Rhodovulum imhoffii]PTN00576.1 uncharacterized protein DUF2155 [Rhodovulum imhoffii]